MKTSLNAELAPGSSYVANTALAQEREHVLRSRRTRLNPLSTNMVFGTNRAGLSVSVSWATMNEVMKMDLFRLQPICILGTKEHFIDSPPS